MQIVSQWHLWHFPIRKICYYKWLSLLTCCWLWGEWNYQVWDLRVRATSRKAQARESFDVSVPVREIDWELGRQKGEVLRRPRLRPQFFPGAPNRKTARSFILYKPLHMRVWSDVSLQQQWGPICHLWDTALMTVSCWSLTSATKLPSSAAKYLPR